MAPAFAAYARSILGRALSADREARHAANGLQTDSGGSVLASTVSYSLHLARDAVSTTRPDPEAGVIHPQDLNNKFIFILFGLIGAALIVVAIWFFFWAKNGGFYFKKNDWEEYKSTVLRRKGPNGTILSGATTETDLGGASVFKDVGDGDDTTVITGTTGLTGITGGVSDFAGRERRRKKREQKAREKERRREEKRLEKEEKTGSKSSNRRKIVGDGGVIDDEAEAEAAEHLRNYRYERPARVGGINKESDSSHWAGSSTNPTTSASGDHTESKVTSELISNRERRPTGGSPDKARTTGRIRKVYSTADKRDSRETDRIRAEAKRLQEKGRAAALAGAGPSSSHTRRFSWQRANRLDEARALVGPRPSNHGGSDEVETRMMPGSWAASDVASDLGTKSYHHEIPGLGSSSGAASSVAGTDARDYAEEKRKRRAGAGYRRDR